MEVIIRIDESTQECITEDGKWYMLKRVSAQHVPTDEYEAGTMKKVKTALILLTRLPVTLLIGLLRWDARYLRKSLAALWTDTRKFLGGRGNATGQVSMRAEAGMDIATDDE